MSMMTRAVIQLAALVPAVLDAGRVPAQAAPEGRAGQRAGQRQFEPACDIARHAAVWADGAVHTGVSAQPRTWPRWLVSAATRCYRRGSPAAAIACPSQEVRR
jgi:hypothetical protein